MSNYNILWCNENLSKSYNRYGFNQPINTINLDVSRKLAKPEDIAETASFLISRNSSHITGETIRVCGGLVML